MDLDIGARRAIDGDQVFLVGQCHSSAEPPFVLSYDAVKRRRFKRNIRKVDPAQVVAASGAGDFVEVRYPGWGTVWFRNAKIRGIRALSAAELLTSPQIVGSLVLFEHDPEPEDANAGFLLFGIETKQAARLLDRAVART